MQTTCLLSLTCALALGSACAQDAGLPVDVAPSTRSAAQEAELGEKGRLISPTWERVQALGGLLSDLETGLAASDRAHQGFVAYLAHFQKRWLRQLEVNCPSVEQLRELRALRSAAKETYDRALHPDQAAPGIARPESEGGPAKAGVTAALSGPTPASSALAPPVGEELTRRLARLRLVLDLHLRPVTRTAFVRELARIGKREFDAVLDLTESVESSDVCQLGELERRLARLERN